MQPSRQGLGSSFILTNRFCEIATQQARLRELEQQKTELENTEIVGMVRGLEVTPEELATIIQAIRSGNTGGPSVAAQNPEEQEEMDDEE